MLEVLPVDEFRCALSAARARASPYIFNLSLDCAYSTALYAEALARRPWWRRCDSELASSHDGCHAVSPNASFKPPIHLSLIEYEAVDWDAALRGTGPIVSHFCVRKGLARKAGLADVCARALAKGRSGGKIIVDGGIGGSSFRALARALPATEVIDLMPVYHGSEDGSSRPTDRASALAWAMADAEALCDVASSAAAEAGRPAPTWIVKPSLANRAAGIAIVADAAAAAAHVCSPALRAVGQWVFQRYIERPLTLCGRKFHLRVYVLADGDLSVHVFRTVLALCAAARWDAAAPPSDARVHITNTCVAAAAGGSAFDEAASVHTLADLSAELAARRSAGAAAGAAQTAALYGRICAIVADTFRALRGQPAAYVPLGGAFELYGVDFLVEDEGNVDASEAAAPPAASAMEHDAEAEDAASRAGIHLRLLEFNPTPDIAQSGHRLRPAMAAMLDGALRIAVDSRCPPPLASQVQSLSPPPPSPPVAAAAAAGAAELAARWLHAAELAEAAGGATGALSDASLLLQWDCILRLPPRVSGQSGMHLTEAGNGSTTV